MIGIGIAAGVSRPRGLIRAIMALFSAGEKGVFYDPSDLATMYQDSVGTTAVTAVGQPVGLMLDKSQGLVLVNMSPPATSGTSGWTGYVATVTSDGTSITATNTTAGEGYAYCLQGLILANKTYKVSFEVVSRTTGAGNVQIGQTVTGVTGLGTKSLIVKATNTHGLWIGTGSTVVGASVTFKNISVKELPGYHATQATSTARPILARHPISGRRNLLNATETLSTQSVTVTASQHTIAFGGTGSVTLSGAYVGVIGDLNPPAAASSPTITLGTTSPTLTGEVVPDEDGRIRKLGGNGVANSGSTYPHSLFSTEYNLSFDASTRTTVGAIVEFTTSCPKFEILQVGSSTGWRLIVDGKHAGTFDGHAADGSLKYVLVDFSAIDPGAVSRHIRIEYAAKSVLVSLKMDTVGSLETVTYSDEMSICFLGDSFTEGTGMSEVETHAGYAPYAAKRMGFKNYAMSGFGGTGYKKDFYPGYGPTRPNLATRCVWDAVGYDAYVIAMGINDTGDTDIDAEIAATFNTIRANNPTAPIYVLGVWGNGSGAHVSNGATIDAKISEACSGRDGFTFIPVYQVAFTKSDATHPDAAGHITLGTYVADQIQALDTELRSKVLRFTPSAGSLTATVSGSVKLAQLELGSTPTDYQKVVSTYDATEAGVADAYHLKFDGVDDFMVTPSIDFSATDKMSVFAGVRKLSDAAVGVVVGLSNAPSTTDGATEVLFPYYIVGGFTGVGTVNRGTFKNDIAGTNNTAPYSAVVTSLTDISGTAFKGRIRVNGAQQASNVLDLGTGNFGNHPLYIGMRAGTAVPFNGHLYSMIIRGALSDAAQIANAETYVNSKTGAY